MKVLTARERQLVRMVVVVVLPVFALAYGLRPAVRAYLAQRERVEIEADLLRREVALVADSARLGQSLRLARETLNGELSSTLAGPARATLTSALTDRIRTLARREQVLVQQLVEMPTDSSSDQWLRVRVALRAESDLAGVSRFLLAIQRDTMRLRIEQVRVEHSFARAPDGRLPLGDGRHVLTFGATVEAIGRVSSVGARETF